MRVTRRGQVTIPVDVRRALGIQPGSEVDFELDNRGARIVLEREPAAVEVLRMRGAGDIELTTDEILGFARQ